MRCRLLGHRYRFRADGTVMAWTCERCGRLGGSKQYASADAAAEFASAFDREDRGELGRRAPLIGLLPLRIWRLWRDRK
jgi:hypothetical protein